MKLVLFLGRPFMCGKENVPPRPSLHVHLSLRLFVVVFLILAALCSLWDLSSPTRD